MAKKKKSSFKDAVANVEVDQKKMPKGKPSGKPRPFDKGKPSGKPNPFAKGKDKNQDEEDAKGKPSFKDAFKSAKRRK